MFSSRFLWDHGVASTHNRFSPPISSSTRSSLIHFLQRESDRRLERQRVDDRRGRIHSSNFFPRWDRRLSRIRTCLLYAVTTLLIALTEKKNGSQWKKRQREIFFFLLFSFPPPTLSLPVSLSSPTCQHARALTPHYAPACLSAGDGGRG